MANRYFGNDHGKTEFDITQGSSTTSKDVEVVVDLSAGMSKNDVLVKLKEISNYILKNIWPPA